MKNKKIISIFIILILFNIQNVNANDISASPATVQINRWSEVDVVNNSDLQVSMLLEIHVNKSILKNFNNITIYFDEFEKSWSEPVDKINVFACSYPEAVSFGGHNYGDIELNCSNNLTININSSQEPRLNPYAGYKFEIMLDKVDFSITNPQLIHFKLNYTIPIFLTGDTKGIIDIKTDCGGSNCPDSKNILKYIVLPNNLYIDSYSQNSELDQKYGKRVITLSDFTPSSESMEKYSTIIINYTDRDKEFRNNLLTGIFIGLISGAILELGIYYFFKRKDMRKLNNQLYDINKKLDDNTNSINKMINKLGKLSKLLEQKLKKPRKKKTISKTK